VTPPALLASGWLITIRHLITARDRTSSNRASDAAREWARAEQARYLESLNRAEGETRH
jgi:hypothetical protein